MNNFALKEIKRCEYSDVESRKTFDPNVIARKNIFTNKPITGVPQNDEFPS